MNGKKIVKNENFPVIIQKYKNIILYIPGSPDPDAMASAYALKKMMEYYSVDSDIVVCQKLSLSQNAEFVKLLNIPLKESRKINLEKYDAYGVTDFQNNIIKNATGVIPCAIHIDHHERSDKCEKAEFTLIDSKAGSASTLVALIMKELEINFDNETMENIATALIFGIQTDTDRYTHATPKDMEALKYLTPYSIKRIIKRLNVKPLDPETILYYKSALEHETIYKDWGIYSIGYINIKNRDSLAIVADLLLKNSELATVVTFGITEDKYKEELTLDASFRTNNPKLDLDGLIKGITPNGGGRKFKGAFQSKLNFFYNSSDREKLLSLVHETTVEKLKKCKDSNYIIDLKSVYSGFINKITSFLKN